MKNYDLVLKLAINGQDQKHATFPTLLSTCQL